MINGKILIAGPCSVESRGQLLATVSGIMRYGDVDMIRCGVWKPRSRPGGFEGAGGEALRWMNDIRNEIPGVRYMVEVADTTHVEQALSAGVEGVWFGARTVCNPFMVQRLADALRGCTVKVFVKNPMAPDLALWIGAIERVLRSGVRDVYAVHRGFATCLNGHLRNEPLWSLALSLREKMPDVPVICDPSHMAGRREYVEGLSATAMGLGLDGLMVECHVHPDDAMTDASQQVTPQQLHEIVGRAIRCCGAMSAKAVVDKELSSMIDELKKLRDEYTNNN